MSASTLVAGVGNIFLGDDAFGVEVVRRLAQRELPPNVRVVDFGIRGFDLAFALMDGYDTTILVDAVPRGGEPGTLYTIEPDLESLDGAATIDTHSMDPVKVLRLAKSLGGELKRVLVLGCEPGPIDPEGHLGLSELVEAAIEPAIEMIQSLVTERTKE